MELRNFLARYIVDIQAYWIKDKSMQINVQGVGLKVTDALRDYVVEKFSKLERKGDAVTSVSITLTVDKLQQIAKSDLAVRGESIHTEASDESMYAAIDALIDKVNRQLIKYNETH